MELLKDFKIGLEIPEDLKGGVVGGRGWRLKVLEGIIGFKGVWGVLSGDVCGLVRGFVLFCFDLQEGK